MNDIINEDVIEKVVIKSVAIYKAMSVLPAPPFEDKFKKETIICQQNEIIQSQNLEKCLNAIEPSKEKETIDTTNEIKNDYEKKSWKDITNPKLRRKIYCNIYNKKHGKVWRQNNKNKRKRKNKNWYQKNKNKIRIYRNNKKKTDIQYKLSENLRGRLRNAIQGNQKVGSAVKDLGCTIDELKTYLESKFKPSMTWDNYGFYGWHIDHIKPLASFDLTDRKQFLEVCHYTNLQPLWANENLSKGKKVEILEKKF